MSIKAGRVGVNPSQVDPVNGFILSSAISGYTKQEADAKFLTQTDAVSTYESKSDASAAYNALQPKTLAVPIEMLSGTKLTVESALSGLNDDKTDDVVLDGTVTSLISGVQLIYKKYGKIACLYITGAATAAGIASGVKLCDLPDIPTRSTGGLVWTSKGIARIIISNTGEVVFYGSALTEDDGVLGTVFLLIV